MTPTGADPARGRAAAREADAAVHRVTTQFHGEARVDILAEMARGGARAIVPGAHGVEPRKVVGHLDGDSGFRRRRDGVRRGVRGGGRSGTTRRTLIDGVFTRGGFWGFRGGGGGFRGFGGGGALLRGSSLLRLLRRPRRRRLLVGATLGLRLEAILLAHRRRLRGCLLHASLLRRALALTLLLVLLHRLLRDVRRVRILAEVVILSVGVQGSHDSVEIGVLAKRAARGNVHATRGTEVVAAGEGRGRRSVGDRRGIPDVGAFGARTGKKWGIQGDEGGRTHSLRRCSSMHLVQKRCKHGDTTLTFFRVPQHTAHRVSWRTTSSFIAPARGSLTPGGFGFSSAVNYGRSDDSNFTGRTRVESRRSDLRVRDPWVSHFVNSAAFARFDLERLAAASLRRPFSRPSRRFCLLMISVSARLRRLRRDSTSGGKQRFPRPVRLRIDSPDGPHEHGGDGDPHRARRDEVPRVGRHLPVL